MISNRTTQKIAREQQRLHIQIQRKRHTEVEATFHDFGLALERHGGGQGDRVAWWRLGRNTEVLNQVFLSVVRRSRAGP